MKTLRKIKIEGFKHKATQDTLIFEYERVEYNGLWNYAEPIAAGHKESKLEEAAGTYKNKIPRHVFPKVRNLVGYHFHDTTDTFRSCKPAISPTKKMAMQYKETSDGPTLLEKIEMPAIRAACPYLAAWLNRLEGVAQRPTFSRASSRCKG